MAGDEGGRTPRRPSLKTPPFSHWRDKYQLQTVFVYNLCSNSEFVVCSIQSHVSDLLFCVVLYLGILVDSLCFMIRCSSGKTATKEFTRIEPACSGSLGYPWLKINVSMIRYMRSPVHIHIYEVINGLKTPGVNFKGKWIKEFIKTTFQDIVADEFKKIKDSSLDEISGMTVDDALWEYDGLHTAYQGECEEILLEMQRIFYEDLRTEPATREYCFTNFFENMKLISLVSEEGIYIKNWEDEEDEYLARAVYEHMKLSDEQEHKVMWCPICTQGQLQDKYCLIFCTLCEFKLNRDDEVTMDLLENRLVEVHAEHLDRGCRLKPKFCMKTIGLTALYIECQGCGTFEVVI
ncbi:hypothetical protein RHMOL_Rhmol01G0332300 [Rhododendron molle]|uniref:Uncharacterized protein n=1 Tax=Rhododendron molle TaxID=49168 RepID=A0ACC0Q8H5_RHOML|nr:hypothetical protein RHMOL_Rhmol01G0332300 [Rhododendron molle]